MPQISSPLPIACLLLVLAAPVARAEAPPRAADMVAAEMLPGWRQAGGTHMAGLRLRLAERWKTYWRSPGEAGIPPLFDFTGSENLAGVEVLWPRPRVFTLNGLRTIGYAREVVLPLRVRPADPGRDVVLRGTVDMGVCRDICLPVTLTLAAALPAAATTPDPAIAAAVQAMPAGGKAAGLGALACRVDPISDGLQLTAAIDLPAQGGTEMVVVETDDPAIWISEATTTRAGGRLTAVADLVSPSGAPVGLDRSKLRLKIGRAHV